MTRIRYGIFISSPSDVRPERAVAERVVRKLATEFDSHCDIEAIAWEREPLSAAYHFQDPRSLPPPHATDICVVILWSRLGVQLPEAEFRGALTGNPVTGTEWEFEDALASYRERSSPELLVYQKTAPIVAVDLRNRARIEEQQREYTRLERFTALWFRDPDTSGWRAAIAGFVDAVEFEDVLEEHLRKVLRRRLERDQVRISSAATPIVWTKPPWRGLAAFQPEHSAVFFGRARARNELRELLAARIDQGTAFLVVLGASGSGKSSLVRAGLLPDLMLPGMIGDIGLVRYAILRGAGGRADPIEALAEAMLAEDALPELSSLRYTPAWLAEQLRSAPVQANLAVEQGLARAAEGTLSSDGRARLLLVVDQLEELFTLNEITPAQRNGFVSALAALARGGLVWVVATLRSDFYDRVEGLPALAALAQGGYYLLAPPVEAEFGEIVRRPARAAGLRFDSDESTGEVLDDVIVRAAAADPSALPLVSFVMDQLWQRRVPELRLLTFTAYRELGGFEGALGRRATEIFDALPPALQGALPDVLLALVNVSGDADNRPTARAALLRSFPTGTAAHALVEALSASDARLLVAEGGHGREVQVRIAHEALFSAWSRVRELIDQLRAELLRRSRVEAAAALWSKEDRAAGRLLGAGLPVSEAEAVVKRFNDLDPVVHAFVRASSNAAAAAARRLRLGALGVLVILLALTIGAGIAAYSARREASVGRAALASSAATLSQIYRTDYPQRSLLLAVAAVKITADKDEPVLPGAVEALTQTLQQSGGAVMSAYDKPVTNVQLSPDGRWLATAAATFKLSRLTGNGTAASTPIDLGATGGEMVFSPDSHWLLTVGADSQAQLWDLFETGPDRTARSLEGATGPVVFSDNSTWLITGGQDRQVRLWSLVGTPREPIKLPAQKNKTLVVSVSQDSHWLATSSWDAQASPGIKSVCELWDLTAEQPETSGRSLPGGEVNVSNATFTKDSRWLVTTSAERQLHTGRYDGTARIWDLRRPDPVVQPLELMGHEGPITAVATSADGQFLATGGADGTVRVWNLKAADPRKMPVTLSEPVDRVAGLAIAHNDRWVVAVSGDTTPPPGGTVAAARLWPINTSQADKQAPPLPMPVSGYETSSDNRWFLIHSGQDAYVLDLESAEPSKPPGMRTLHGHEGAISAASISSDNRSVVTGSADQSVRVWQLATARSIANPIGVPAAQDALLRFSPDGHWLATIGDTGTTPGLDRVAMVWDLRAREVAATARPLRGHDGELFDIAFSPDEHWVATSSDDKTARLWNLDAPDLTPASWVLSGHTSTVARLAFSPNGRWFATRGSDNTVHLWDMQRGVPSSSSTVLKTHGSPGRIDISSDSRWLLASGATSTATLWDLSAEDPAESGRILNDSQDSVIMSVNGRWVVTVGNDERDSLLHTFRDESDPRTRQAMQQRISQLEPVVTLWDVGAHDLTSATRRLGDVRPLEFSSNSRWLLTVGRDKVPRVLSLAAGTGDMSGEWTLSATTLDATLPDTRRQRPARAALSPDSRWLATAGDDGTLRLWELNGQGEPRMSREVTRFGDATVAFSGDSSLLVAQSGSNVSVWKLGNDGSTSLWSSVRVNKDTLVNPAVSADHRWLFTRDSETPAINLWRLNRDELVDSACRAAGRNFSADEWQQYFAERAYEQVCPGAQQ